MKHPDVLVKRLHRGFHANGEPVSTLLSAPM
jgi:hypothetical protein